ncbi:hypothetical protein [Sphingomonas nostoxanthinifaciens]|uniref:hypothetical protein n=1 Tax=Sphingomonas nostoxanthinifaciens TaxID=2872652 RepID=UPI001CC2150B|nr:hypothetical protein [Sphingomonas nostoxanthinifaciens]UAK23637.1 hypothetical protein K8P63_14775 [Sphingomonas nostoxanthinifaciens]
MPDRPIIFSAPMVRALLDGRKTQTRRILNPQPELFPIDEKGTLCTVSAMQVDGDDHHRVALGSEKAGVLTTQRIRYGIGDRLYVREAWSHTGVGVWSIGQARMAAHSNGHPIYRATDKADAGTKFWPSIHMPREFSRLTLIVEGVKVERLQGISEADAQAEGVAKLSWDGEGHWFEDDVAGTFRCGFAGIWQHLHGPDSWDANPFVVALTFRVVHGNIDRIPA